MSAADMQPTIDPYNGGYDLRVCGQTIAGWSPNGLLMANRNYHNPIVHEAHAYLDCGNLVMRDVSEAQALIMLHAYKTKLEKYYEG